MARGREGPLAATMERGEAGYNGGEAGIRPLVVRYGLHAIEFDDRRSRALTSYVAGVTMKQSDLWIDLGRCIMQP